MNFTVCQIKEIESSVLHADLLVPSVAQVEALAEVLDAANAAEHSVVLDAVLADVQVEEVAIQGSEGGQPLVVLLHSGKPQSGRLVTTTVYSRQQPRWLPLQSSLHIAGFTCGNILRMDFI